MGLLRDSSVTARIVEQLFTACEMQRLKELNKKHASKECQTIKLVSGSK
jgi:hypothetical protein